MEAAQAGIAFSLALCVFDGCLVFLVVPGERIDPTAPSLMLSAARPEIGSELWGLLAFARDTHLETPLRG